MPNETKFIHNVSKGSKFNQIYIPQEMKKEFEVGDLVEVKLIEKKGKLFYSKNLKELSDFKLTLIKNIFQLSKVLKDIKQTFIFGSFLTNKNEYHDIDILLISDKKEIDSKFYNLLNEKFDLKFHVISIEQDKFNNLIKICPLTRSMLYYYVSNGKFNDLPERVLDKKYIKYLLMLPEDLLEVELNSRIFYESLRKIVAIENFVFNKIIDPVKIDDYLIKEFGEKVIKRMRDNESINSDEIKKIRQFLRAKLKIIPKVLDEQGR